jgi:hypothetical protein
MTKSKYSPKLKHSPTLNTVLMVEDTIKKSNHSAIKIAELKRLLPHKVNHNTLKIVLEYLENSNKIVFGLKGITWIQNTNLNIQKAIANGLEL